MYIDYDLLKTLIKTLENLNLKSHTDHNSTSTCLSKPRPTNAAGMPEKSQSISQESFYQAIEREMQKIEKFTSKKVLEVRNLLFAVESMTSNLMPVLNRSESEIEEMQKKVEEAGETFLRLEKYVNLNFTGFHKILKKHDRRLPNPCKAFYIARLHNQSWVESDHSDIMVLMSRVYSKLRGDKDLQEVESASQNFVRSTRKYWVHT